MNIQFIGYGHMGSSIWSLILDQDKGAQLAISTQTRVACNTQADIVFLCVKPQQFSALDLSVYDTHATCVSIMNGITTDTIWHFKNIIRTMPNLFGEVHQGITGWYEKGNCSDSIRQYVQQIFVSSGIIIHLDQEIDFAAFTAFAGCGPAIVAYLEQYCQDGHRAQIYEDLRNAGLILGMADEQVALIVSKLRTGLPLYLQKHHLSHQWLIEKVSSTWWSTEAIIQYFEEHNLGGLLQENHYDHRIADIIVQGIMKGKLRADALGK